ncbi:hypothetical protein [Vibrio vulnificus]|uniref:hypothetical protein n=1 Tax=Vibrio vulnificus TaxID=672 RepID=UPI000CD185A0|nr:hypothetical protein [Vibrio vulnificus]POB90256.1 hypothetical protein CRN40_00905 [Vibrio vulnificus]
MNQFLQSLFDIIAIDTEHLNLYLTLSEKQYLNNALKSIEDLNGDFYSNEEGENLEILLHFLKCHAQDIAIIWEGRCINEIRLKLYTSSAISGGYQCFHFDLSKFEQTYKSSGQKLTLYRVGREGESKDSLGNSWAKDFSGLKNYIQSSCIQIDSRPIFAIEINDSEILCEGNTLENELILKKDFTYSEVRLLDIDERNKIFI